MARRKQPRYSATFDVDGYPLAFLQADRPYLVVQRLPEHLHQVFGLLGYTQHLTARAAQLRAKRDRGVPVCFNGITRRWEVLI